VNTSNYRPVAVVTEARKKHMHREIIQRPRLETWSSRPRLETWSSRPRLQNLWFLTKKNLFCHQV